MHTISGFRLPRRLRRRTGVAVAALTATAVVSGLTAAPVASLPPSPECPMAYPLADLDRGDRVDGLTVSSGTEPEGFTGEILGVINDGIAPGLDMIMAELTSDEIDRVGIWQGMSGSPVYAQDGRLIGAVAYGLAWGPSPVAGITPAEEMYRLLEDAPTVPAAAEALAIAEGAETVDIPPVMAQRMATTGAATEEEAEEGLSRLLLPLGISGMSTSKRLRQAKKAFDLSGVRVYRSGSVTTDGEPIPVKAGGNLAASISYGDVSATGVGTATAVCGNEVLAFGHPMAYTGPSQMSMHGADAVYVQEDPVGPGFKVANAGAPIGSISQDRLAGIYGLAQESEIPRPTSISSFVNVPGEWSRTGTTKINVPDAVPDISAFHLLADQDRVFDGIGGGAATVGWTVTGRRADNRKFIFERTDMFANEYDLSWETTWDLYDQLAKMHFNDIEDITIDKIETSSVMSRRYAAYKIAKVRVKVAGVWRALPRKRPLFLRGGTTKRFQVLLSSPALGPAKVMVNLEVPRSIGRRGGILEIVGGNSSYYGGEDVYFEEEMYLGDESGSDSPETFGALLAQMRNQPQNNHVVASLMIFKRGGTIKRSAHGTAKAIVNGGVAVEVQGLGVRRKR